MYNLPNAPEATDGAAHGEENVKMGFLFSGVFWGIVLCLLGVSMILKVVFSLDIPVFRIVMAGVLIVLGIRLLLGVSWKGNLPSGNTVVFSESEMKGTGTDKDYTVVFGRGTLDLAGVLPEDHKEPIEFTTVFGAGTLRLDPAVPTKVTVSSAFAGARVPDGTQIAFGNYVYRTPGQSDDAPYIDVRATVVFGEMKVETP